MSRHRQGSQKKMRDVSMTELENAIDEWILNEKHRMVLRRRLIDGVLMSVVLMPVAVAEWADIPAMDIPGTKTWRCRSGK